LAPLADESTWPWMASLGEFIDGKWQHKCGGSLVSWFLFSRYVTLYTLRNTLFLKFPLARQPRVCSCIVYRISPLLPYEPNIVCGAAYIGCQVLTIQVLLQM
jgi:hypothetical protein